MRSILEGELAAPRRVWVGPPSGQVAVSVLARPVIGLAGEVVTIVSVGHDVTALVEVIEVRDGFAVVVDDEPRAARPCRGSGSG